MKEKVTTILKYLIGLALGGVLMYAAFRQIDLENVSTILQQTDLRWIGLALVGSLVANWLRALRWRMLLEASGYQLSPLHSFCALQAGYMANNAVPRMGEVTRCTVLIRSDKIPFVASAGTVVTERAIDVITLLSLIGITFLLEFKTLLQYFQVVGFWQKIQSYSLEIWFTMIIMFVGIIGFFWYWKGKFLQNPIIQKIVNFIREILKAALSVRKLKNLNVFLIYTFLIWLLYVLIPYFTFFAIPQTANLSFYFAFILMVMGGIGMTIPVPGGVGPFHNAILFTFTAYGLSRDSGASLALLIHTPQFILILITGAIAYFYLIFQKNS
ncbi:MAG: flippase-like domain-containing protein [Bacteroidia bacterium]|nr:flippase-like domain-containing protein [Bacteroidia bacterium]